VYVYMNSVPMVPGLFYDAVSISDDIASNGRMIGE
jgi:hypothetical protein